MVRENKTECKMTFRNEEPHVNKRFPRVRGDVPQSRVLLRHPPWFSPRARGCSRFDETLDRFDGVFPACAGMFPTPKVRRLGGSSFPRVRGDVPMCVTSSDQGAPFSPRARGCSMFDPFMKGWEKVFPACAGMFLIMRIRLKIGIWFSPRARGCSSSAHKTLRGKQVFPACAGMFRTKPAWVEARSRFPRVRGDVPRGCPVEDKGHTFSPRARGCSSLMDFTRLDMPVFPACAGMFPTRPGGNRGGNRFPRVRGDVPPRVYQTRQHDKFSPRARGCSHLSVVSAVDNRVFPACAGMFPNDASRR